MSESISLAADLAYRHREMPFDEQTFIDLLRLALIDVLFQVGNSWYRQVDGLAMGSKLAVYLANIWMSQFESRLGGKRNAECGEDDKSPVNVTDVKNPCGICTKTVNRGYAIQCSRCGFWHHRVCIGYTTSQIRALKPGSWHCGCRWKITPSARDESKLFFRYMDDIISICHRDQTEHLLEEVNCIHRNLSFTIEVEENGKIPFLDMMLIRQGPRVSTAWFRKPTDTNTCLNYYACAPTRYKRNTVEGTVHRIFNCTSSWKLFHEGLSEAKWIWEANQYPPSFYQPIVNEALNFIITGKRSRGKAASDAEGATEDRPKSVESTLCPSRDRSLLLMQYHGKISDRFSRRIRTICPRINVVFVTRKLKTFMPSLKGKIPDELKSRVIYEITCPGCEACYVGMTSRHLCTRLEEHRKESAPVAQHLKSCGVSDFGAKIIDSCFNVVKLATLESLYIEKQKPSINTREEYRQRPLSIKLIQ